MVKHCFVVIKSFLSFFFFINGSHVVTLNTVNTAGTNYRPKAMGHIIEDNTAMVQHAHPLHTHANAHTRTDTQAWARMQLRAYTLGRWDFSSRNDEFFT